LIAAALVPTAITKREFARIGFDKKRISHSRVLLGWACITTFPLMVCGLWLMRYWGVDTHGQVRGTLPFGLLKLFDNSDSQQFTASFDNGTYF
jgi:hypothetical protein